MIATSPQPTLWRKRSKALFVIGAGTAIVVGLVSGVVWGWWQHHYPYGWSHCCDKQLYLYLLQYADAHDGSFPKGETTPEASLSLLQRYFAKEDLAGLLRGKSVPESVTAEILARDELLGPESCGWNYVEGLRNGDSSQLALFWDNAGLDHNGGRLPNGGHIVTFVSGNSEYIPESKWPEFIEEQQRLLGERDPAEKHETK